MALILAGQNFSTLPLEGINLALCDTYNTTANPEYPAPRFQFGTKTIGLDASEWIYASPAGAYAIGTAGFFSNDGLWTFTAATTANATLSGQRVGILSQVASVTASPTTTAFDGVWVQVEGGAANILVAASTTANTQLYTSTVAGVLTSTAGANVAVNGISLTTARAASQGLAPGYMSGPVILLTE